MIWRSSFLRNSWELFSEERELAGMRAKLSAKIALALRMGGKCANSVV